jgi:hypothetical protein
VKRHRAVVEGVDVLVDVLPGSAVVVVVGRTTQPGGPAGAPGERPGTATAPAHPNCEKVSSLVIVPPSRNIATLVV